MPLAANSGYSPKGIFHRYLAGIEIDGVQRAPWRRYRGITILIEELAIAGEAVLQVRASSPAGCGCGNVFRNAHKAEQRREFLALQFGKTGHAAFALVDELEHLRARHAAADADQCRKRRSDAFTMIAMADGAVCRVACRAGGIRERARCGDRSGAADISCLSPLHRDSLFLSPCSR